MGAAGRGPRSGASETGAGTELTAQQPSHCMLPDHRQGGRGEWGLVVAFPVLRENRGDL